jgi:hypothetical protein
MDKMYNIKDRLMDIPNKNTFEVLEGLKNYLMEKNQKNGNKNDYILAEIKSLERITIFTKFVLNYFPNNYIEKMVIEYETKFENILNEQKEDDSKYEVIYSYEKRLSKNYKLNVSFIKYPKEDYILIEPKKYVKNKFRWENHGKFKITPTVLEEILNEHNKPKDNLPKYMEKEVIETYKPENIINMETVTDKEKNEIVYRTFDDSLSKNHRLKIILSVKNNGIKYISMEESRKCSAENNFFWNKIGRIKMTINKLERILRRTNEVKYN